MRMFRSLHVAGHNTAQTGECEHSACDHQHTDRCGKPTPAEDWGSEQHRKREEEVLAEDVESVCDRGPLEGQEQRQPQLPGERGLSTQCQDNEVHAACHSSEQDHEDDRGQAERLGVRWRPSVHRYH